MGGQPSESDLKDYGKDAVVEDKKETVSKNEKDTVLYHVAEPIFDAAGEIQRTKKGRVIRHTPTHTLVFSQDKGQLLMSYSQARVGLDCYRKATGRHIALARMDKLRNLKTYLNPIDDITLKHASEVLPNHVTNSLNYYVDKARSYYKLNDATNLVFKGDKRSTGIVIMSIPAREPKE